jgi:DNA-binding transcriptional regulator LsrR (DeoR family)
VDRDAVAEQATLAAWLYYERGLNQEEIARRIAVSRSTVSRLLSHAREIGIVDIRINRPLPEVARLESALHERFPLELVQVEPKDPGESPAEAAARAAGRFRIHHPPCVGVIGVGWGRTLRAAAQLVTRGPVAGVSLVDVVGRPPAKDALVAVSRLLAVAWSVEAISVPAPAFAASPRMRNELCRDSVVEATLAKARDADLIVLSIGGTDSSATLVEEGIVGSEVMGRLRAAGAVGDLLGHFYDARGREVTVPPLVAPIGLDLEDLRSARLVVAIAAGDAKVQAIGAAARGGLISGLITDDTTARSLLQS